MSLDGFSMRPLVRELNAALAGGRIDKITQPNKQQVIFSVRQPGQNFLLQVSINSQNPSAHLLGKNRENPPEPPVFAAGFMSLIASPVLLSFGSVPNTSLSPS